MTTIERTKTVKTSRRLVRIVDRLPAGPDAPRMSIAVNGQILSPGRILEVSEQEAVNLIVRGIATDASPEQIEASASAVVVAPVPSNVSWSDAS